MDGVHVMGLIFPVAALVMLAAFVIGVRSSGRTRTEVSDVERRLRERTFTGAPRAVLEWPHERRRPSLARLAQIGESYGYRLVDSGRREHVTVLRFEKADDDEL